MKQYFCVSVFAEFDILITKPAIISCINFIRKLFIVCVFWHSNDDSVKIFSLATVQLNYWIRWTTFTGSCSFCWKAILRRRIRLRASRKISMPIGIDACFHFSTNPPNASSMRFWTSSALAWHSRWHIWQLVHHCQKTTEHRRPFVPWLSCQCSHQWGKWNIFHLPLSAIDFFIPLQYNL